MAEKPILFSGSMVRAILEGRKTQTRRTVKFDISGRVKAIGSRKNWHPDDPDVLLASPFKTGDLLWVKETWQAKSECLWSIKPTELVDYASIVYAATSGDFAVGRWRSPLFMQRRFSRISLRVTGVRVERLQDISYADASAEGLISKVNRNGCRVFGTGGPSDDVGVDWSANPVDAYRLLWGKINGKSSWAANPRVWVIEFERVK